MAKLKICPQNVHTGAIQAFYIPEILNFKLMEFHFMISTQFQICIDYF
jgi:hypothetical protein